jgi:hypothetical protein
MSHSKTFFKFAVQENRHISSKLRQMKRTRVGSRWNAAAGWERPQLQ